MRKMEKAEPRSFDDAVTDLLSVDGMARARAMPTRTNGYIVNGEYSRSLAGFLRTFPREQILVIFSTALSQYPQETLRDVFSFLEVSDFLPDNLGTRYRKAASRQRIPGLSLVAWHMAASRVGIARRFWFLLPSTLRNSILRAYNVATYRVELWNGKRSGVSETMTQATRQRLISHFTPDSEALAELLDCEIPWLAGWHQR
jgi:hypothetical protein